MPLKFCRFTCKVTVHLDGLVNTIMECFSDPPNLRACTVERHQNGSPSTRDN
jgi:hypothetical protein